MGFSRFLEYTLSAVWGYPAQLPLGTWNCSAAAPLHASNSYGLVAGATVCVPGECCTGMIGGPAWSDDRLARVTPRASRLTAILLSVESWLVLRPLPDAGD